MLLETLIGLLVGFFILAATVFAFSGMSRYSQDNIHSVRLEHELRTAMRLMIGDVRRAGYWAYAANDVGRGKNSNPFMQTNSDLKVVDGNCILLSYDLNKDGSLPPLNHAGGDERFGYRLFSGALQSRAAMNTTFSCTQGNWENLTHANLINISSLSFSVTNNDILMNGTGSDIIQTRTVTITISGHLIADPSVVRSVSEIVRVRNDKFIPAA